jgi:hypothetical protein
MYEELIRVQGAAAAVVCAGITARQLAVMQDSVQFAAGLPDGTGCDRRVAAHGQVFTLLAAAAGDSVVAAILGSGAEHLRDLAIGAGPEAAGDAGQLTPPAPGAPARRGHRGVRR